jgi:hypothetical protein
MTITKVTDAGLDKSRIVTPLIINGDMAVAQRTTSTTGVGADVGHFACDRWKLEVEGSPSARFTQTQSTDVPTGQGFTTSLKMDCTTAAGSPDADDALAITYRIEAQDLQLLRYGTSSAKKITLSFWVNATKTGTHAIWIYQNDDSRSQAQTYTVNTTNTWEKKTVVFAADTTGVIDNNNGEGFRINWWLTAGSNFTSGTLATTWQSHTAANNAVGQVNNADSTDNNWYITGVQMEIGEFDTNTIPSFPFESFENNLKKCQRYYQKIAEGNSKRWDLVSSARTTSYVDFVFPCTVVMRAQPTLDAVSGTEYYYVYSSNGGYDKFSVPVINSNYNEGSTLVTGYYSGGSYTAGDSLFASTDDSSAYLALDAEL